MSTVTLEEAKARLEELIEHLEPGEEFLIMDSGGRWPRSRKPNETRGRARPEVPPARFTWHPISTSRWRTSRSTWSERDSTKPGFTPNKPRSAWLDHDTVDAALTWLSDKHRMTNPFSDLLERSVKPSRLVVGLMSGTSADSIDVAICRMKGQGAMIGVELIHYREHPHAPEVKSQILRAAELNVRAIAELNVLLGETFAEACLVSLKEASVLPAEVDLVGSHGQTIYQDGRFARAGHVNESLLADLLASDPFMPVIHRNRQGLRCTAMRSLPVLLCDMAATMRT